MKIDLVAAVFAVLTSGLLLSCGGSDSEITSCQPFGAKICSDNRLHECRGPTDVGGA